MWNEAYLHEGFDVHIIGLETLKYQENKKFIIFDWAYEPSTKITKVYVSVVEYWSFPVAEKLTSEEKKRIIDNIRMALDLLEGKRTRKYIFHS